MNILNGIGRTQRQNTQPLIVNLRRGSSIESVHRVHAVVSNSKGG